MAVLDNERRDVGGSVNRYGQHEGEKEFGKNHNEKRVTQEEERASKE